MLQMKFMINIHHENNTFSLSKKVVIPFESKTIYFSTKLIPFLSFEPGMRSLSTKFIITLISFFSSA